jgi:hypothetical protein
MNPEDKPRVTLGRGGRFSPPPPQTAAEPASLIASAARSLVMRLAARAASAMNEAACAIADGATLVERLADSGASPLPARPTLELHAAAGETLVRDFVVTNQRVSRLTGVVSSLDWYSDTGSRAAAEIVSFEPAAVDLSAGAIQAVRVSIRVPDDFAAGAAYRATFFIEGSGDFRLPVMLHVAAPPRAAKRRTRTR